MAQGIVGTKSGAEGLVAVRRAVLRARRATGSGAFLWELGLQPSDGLRAWRLLQRMAKTHHRSVAWVLEPSRADDWGRQALEGAWLCAMIAPAAYAGFAWDPPADDEACVYAYWDGFWSWLGVARDANATAALRRAFRRAVEALELGRPPSGGHPYVHGYLAHGGLSPRFFDRIAALLYRRGPAALDAAVESGRGSARGDLPALCAWWFAFLRDQRPEVWSALRAAWRASSGRIPQPHELEGVPLLGVEPRRTKWVQALRRAQVDAQMGYASGGEPESELDASLALRRQGNRWVLGVRLARDAAVRRPVKLVRTATGPAPLRPGQFYALSPSSSLRLETFEGESVWGPVEAPDLPWIGWGDAASVALLPARANSLRVESPSPTGVLCVAVAPRVEPHVWADGVPVSPVRHAELFEDPSRRWVWEFAIDRGARRLRIEAGGEVRELALSDAPVVSLGFEARPWRAWVDGQRWYPSHPSLHLRRLASGWERALAVEVRREGVSPGQRSDGFELAGEALAETAWADGAKVVVDLAPLTEKRATPGLYSLAVKWRGAIAQTFRYGVCGDLVVRLPKGKETPHLELDRSAVKALGVRQLRWKDGARSSDDFSLLLELLDKPAHHAQVEARTTFGRLLLEVPTGLPGLHIDEVDGHQWIRPESGTTCIGLEELLEAADRRACIEVFGAPRTRVRFLLSTASVRMVVPSQGYTIGQGGRLVFSGEALRDLVAKLRSKLAESDLAPGAYVHLSLEMASKGAWNVVRTNYEVCHTSTSAPPDLTSVGCHMVLTFKRVAQAVRVRRSSDVEIWIHRPDDPEALPIRVRGTCNLTGPLGAVIRWRADAAGQSYRAGEVYGFRVRGAGFPPRRVTWWRWQPPRWERVTVDEAAWSETESILRKWGDRSCMPVAGAQRTRDEAVAVLARALQTNASLWERVLAWALQRVGDEPITLTPVFEALCTTGPVAFVGALVEGVTSGSIELPEHWLHPLAERTRMAWRLAPIPDEGPSRPPSKWPVALPHAIGAVEHWGAPWRLVWLCGLAEQGGAPWAALGVLGMDSIGRAVEAGLDGLTHEPWMNFDGAVATELRLLDTKPLADVPRELGQWIRRELGYQATTRKGVVGLGWKVGRHVDGRKRRNVVERMRVLLDQAAHDAPTVLQVAMCLGELAAFRRRSA